MVYSWRVSMLNKAILGTVGAIGLLTSSALAELEWITDFEEGKKIAAESGKTSFLYFTGSDWCKYCILLDNEVLSQEAFEAASEKYVFIKSDLLRKPGAMTPEEQKAAQEFGQSFDVPGRPTVILFDGERPIARTGYRPNMTAESYIAHLDEIAQPYRSLQAATGEGRKDALVAFLETVSLSDLDRSFTKELSELKQLDPEDESGFIAKIAKTKAEAKMMADFNEGYGSKLTNRDYDGALALIDEFIGTNKLDENQLQSFLMKKVNTNVYKGDREGAHAGFDELVTSFPNSPFAQKAESIKANIDKMVDRIVARKKKEAEAKEEQARSESSDSKGDA